MTDRLPQLRDDLKLHHLRGETDFIIEDPVSGQYHRLGRDGFYILAAMKRTQNLEELVRDLMQSKPDLLKAEDIVSFIQILAELGLVKDPDGLFSKKRKEKRDAASASLITPFKKSFFLSFPLLRPDGFLERTYRYVEPFYSRSFLIGLLCLMLVNSLLIIRHATDFFHDVQLIASIEHIPFIALVLFGIKIIHEFAHAYATKRAGAHVASMGVALMFFYPVFYTDVTPSWTLNNKNDKRLIALAGLLAELVIAAVCLFLWTILEDGSLRFGCLFVGTIALTSSVVINANPLMKFDGYYFLADEFGIDNMQSRAIELAKWRLRCLFLGPVASNPEQSVLTPAVQRHLTVYGWSVLIYRVFLYVGVAALAVYVMNPPLDAWLGALIIIVFLGVPFFKEMKEWIGFIGRYGLFKMGRLVVIIGVLLAVMFTPLFNHISVPAVMQPTELKIYYSPAPAQIDRINVAVGQNVKTGDVLIELSSPLMALTSKRLHDGVMASNDRHNRFMVDRDLSQQRDVLLSERDEARKKLNHTQDIINDLTVRADRDGTVLHVIEDAYAGQTIPLQQALVIVGRTDKADVIAYIPEGKIPQDQKWDAFQARFYPRSINGGGYDVVFKSFDATLNNTVPYAALLKKYGGHLSSDLGQPDPQTGLYPVVGRYATLTGILDTGYNDSIVPGDMIIQGDSYSLFDRLLSAVKRLLVRLGF